jgi:hypothetical protein
MSAPTCPKCGSTDYKGMSFHVAITATYFVDENGEPERDDANVDWGDTRDDTLPYECGACWHRFAVKSEATTA